MNTNDELGWRLLRLKRAGFRNQNPGWIGFADALLDRWLRDQEIKKRDVEELEYIVSTTEWLDKKEKKT